MPPRRIGPLWALLIGFVVLMASNSWLKGSTSRFVTRTAVS